MAGSPGAGKTEAAQTLTVLNSNLCVLMLISFVYYFQVMLGIIQMNFNEDHHSW